MLSSDSQGMGRIGEVVRRAFQCADAMKAQLGPGAGVADNERVLRYLAKVTINPAIAHGLAGHVGSLEVGKLADMVMWAARVLRGAPRTRAQGGDARLRGVRRGQRLHHATGEPVLVQRQFGALGSAPARTSLAFLAGRRWRPSCRPTRSRAAVEDCRDLAGRRTWCETPAPAAVEVDADRREVTLDGEPMRAEPVERLAFSTSYLLG